MQGLKPQQVTQKEDKSKAINNLLQSATQMLKNGATPDVVDFAQATLTEITSVVLPAIINASETDQRLVDNTFTMFETALQELEDGNNRVKVAHDTERALSAQHMSCRDADYGGENSEERACIRKRECDYELWAIWRRFVEEESEMRQLSLEVENHFCAEGANGTMWIFRDHSVTLFPPWLEQKPVVEHWEREYDEKVPVCEELFIDLDEKTAECDAIQTQLERAACTHGNTVVEVRNLFAESWAYAVYTYQRVVDEVHCLEIDRWKEWRTLSSVQCLLDRTTERNGRPCDESTDEIVTEVTRCEEIQVTESIDHLRIVYHVIPPFPEPCPTPPWTIVPAVHPWPGRCVPVIPHMPCSGDYMAQEYTHLWQPPQPNFHAPDLPLAGDARVDGADQNSHCNPRAPCMNCQPVPEIAICFGVYGHDAATSWISYPAPEHECSTATRNQLAIGEFDANGDGHWTASYMKMAYGEANCPEGKRITTAAECRYAHMALGLEIDPEWNGNHGGIPGLCSTREEDWGGGHHFHFNTQAVGVVRADLAPVCRA
jgi:hypothetical protein